MTDHLFGIGLCTSTVVNFLGYLAGYYAPTEAAILQAILKSDFVHVDETKINIQGVDHYVWVFTDGKHVVFRMTETREADIVREVLAGYQGVLVSDFYPGYDSMPCRQQKCLVHLIRDINDDLWKAPFDKELEAFAVEVQALLVPILEAVDRYGLKAWHLRKFLKDVDRFYDKNIIGREYTSEPVRTYQKRFDRYRESLFTFLTQDGIPWENNMAERAIRQYSATVGDLKIVDSCRILANSYAAFFAGGVPGGTRVRLGSAAGGRRWWPAGAGGAWSPAGSPATPGSAGSTHCTPAPSSPPDFSPRNRSVWPATNVSISRHSVWCRIRPV